MRKREMSVLAFGFEIVVGNLCAELPDGSVFTWRARVTLPRASVSCSPEGTIYHGVLQMPSSWSSRKRGQLTRRTALLPPARAAGSPGPLSLDFARLGTGTFTKPPPRPGTLAVSPGDNEGGQERTRVPSEDAGLAPESFPRGSDSLYFVTGSEPTRVITRCLTSSGVRKWGKKGQAG